VKVEEPKEEITVEATPEQIEAVSQTLTPEEKKIVDDLVATDTTTVKGKKKARKISDEAEKTKK